MPRGGKREGAGRKAGSEGTFTKERRRALIAFTGKLASEEERAEVDLPGSPLRLERPEHILLNVANGLNGPRGKTYTQAQIAAAIALLPYSVAKPASVSIHHVNRTEVRQMTDEELARIASQQPGRGGGGAFAASESPFLTLDMVRDGSPYVDGDSDPPRATPSLADFGIAEIVGDSGG